jgi:hypothetical protein
MRQLLDGGHERHLHGAADLLWEWRLQRDERAVRLHGCVLSGLRLRGAQHLLGTGDVREWRVHVHEYVLLRRFLRDGEHVLWAWHVRTCDWDVHMRMVLRRLAQLRDSEHLQWPRNVHVSCTKLNRLLAFPGSTAPRPSCCCSGNLGCVCNSGYGPGGKAGCAACDACHSGIDCIFQNNSVCDNRGTCIAKSGGGATCACTGNYDNASMCTACDACHTNFNAGCTAPSNLCGAHGTCIAKSGSCACRDGYSGSTCATPPSSGSAKNEPSPGDAAGIAIGVILCVAVVGT